MYLCVVRFIKIDLFNVIAKRWSRMELVKHKTNKKREFRACVCREKESKRYYLKHLLAKGKKNNFDYVLYSKLFATPCLQVLYVNYVHSVYVSVLLPICNRHT